MSSDTPTRKLRAILNPDAAASERLRAHIQILRERGFEIEVRLTWEAGDARRFAAEAADSVDGVVAAGGDGTVNEVVNGLLRDGRAACPLGVLPYGTGNDFASGLIGLTDPEPEALLDVAAYGAVRTIDAGCVNERYFVNMASGGFGAELTTDTRSELKRVFGSAAYFLKGLVSSFNLHARRLALTMPGLSWHGDAYLVCIANGTQTGGGWQVAPQARFDDGLLDVLVIPQMPAGDVAELLEEVVLRGHHTAESERVLYRQVPWVTIETDEPMQVNLDGEPLFDTSYRFECVHHALRVFVPQDSELRAEGSETSEHAPSRSRR